MNETVFISLPKNELQELIIDCVNACLLHSINKPATIQHADQWFDLSELCSYLPEKPARATVYGWISNLIIPHHKRAKKLFFLKSEIDNWLKQGRRRTVGEAAENTEQFLSNLKKQRG